MNEGFTTPEKYTTYTIDEVCKILRVSRRTVYNYLRDGKLKAFKIGRTNRVTPAELERFMNEAQTETENNDE